MCLDIKFCESLYFAKVKPINIDKAIETGNEALATYEQIRHDNKIEDAHLKHTETIIDSLKKNIGFWQNEKNVANSEIV